jgi:polyphosphate kinase
VIEALYRASQAGVKIDLLVRGICSLRPQWPGLSDLITVRSMVDRFLEHSRIYYFENGGEPEIYAGSPDWMPRNFFRRIEAVFPVEDRRLRERLKNQVLGTCLADNVKAWQLRADGTYARRKPPGGAARRSQAEFLALAAAGR